jgi:hypothetical protein
MISYPGANQKEEIMPSDNYTRNGKIVQEILTTISKGAEQTSGFVERRSKMDGVVFIQTWVLGCMKKAGISLNELAQVSTKLGVPISAPGLDQRIDAEAVSMLQKVFQESLQQMAGQQRLEIGLLERFRAVYISDSTQMELPPALSDCFPGSGGKASPAGLKIQVLYDFLQSTFQAITLGPGNQPDQKCDLHLTHTQANALHLFDLGYFNLQTLAALDQRGAYFITRLGHLVSLYTDEDEPARFNLLDSLRQTTADQLELSLKVGSLVKLRVRTLFQRLPLNVVEERRRKAIINMKEKGRTPSDTYLALLEWNMFITNIPNDWLSFEHIQLLYRVRWQIELIFKLWKSQAGLDYLGSWRKERLLVQLYARLIGLTLFYALTSPFRWLSNRELSLPKAFASFQAKIPALIRTIQRGWRSFFALLKRLFVHWLHYDLKTVRRKYPSTLQQLLAAPT